MGRFDPVNSFNHTSWVAIGTPTDRPKSVLNRCVLEGFGCVFVLSRCFLDFSLGVGAFVIVPCQISSFSYCYIDKPELRSLRLQKVIEGQSLSVTCTVTSANPHPTSSQFTWQQVGGSLEQNQQILRINNIQRSQDGTYMCTATNTMVPTHGQTVTGRESVTVDVDVLCKWL